MLHEFAIGSSSQKRVVFYARVSTGRQADKDISIPAQLRRMRNYCAQNGLEPVGQFTDSQTGTNQNRPGLKQMLEFARDPANEVSVVLVYASNRLARNLIDFIQITRELKELSIEVISVTQSFDDTPQGDLLKLFQGMMDEYQSKEIAKHVSEGMAENARQGFWNGGTPPFGYRSVTSEVRAGANKKKLVINPSESEDVRMIFQLYLDGTGKSGPLGVKRIVSHLNTMGLTRRNGSKWTVGMLHRVLTDRAYLGEYVYGKNRPQNKQIMIEVPEIIDAVTFERVQQQLRKRNPRKTPPRMVSSPVLLAGLAKCGKCGSSMILRTGKSGRYRYYTCGSQVRKGKSECSGQSVPMDELDELVTNIAADAGSDPVRSGYLLRELAKLQADKDFETQARKDALLREKKTADETVDRLFRLVEVGVINVDDPDFRPRFDRARDEQSIIKAKLDRLVERQLCLASPSGAQVSEFAKLLRQMIVAGSTSFRKSYLSALLQEVKVNGGTVEIIPHSAVRSGNKAA
jgi:DNA invertase Pin-like site-specific DNA recombinase